MGIVERFEGKLLLIRFTEAPNYLKPNGWLMLEHSYDQAQPVAALLKGHGFSQIDHAQDHADILRVTFGAIA